MTDPFMPVTGCPEFRVFGGQPVSSQNWNLSFHMLGATWGHILKLDPYYWNSDSQGSGRGGCFFQETGVRTLNTIFKG